MTFNERIKEEMEYAGIQHKELAKKAEVTPRALLTYVSATKPSMPPADVAFRLAKSLDVSVEYLVTGVKSETFFSASDKFMLSKFHELEPSDQKLFLELLCTLVKKIK